jgi:hypothetical protein
MSVQVRAGEGWYTPIMRSLFILSLAALSAYPSAATAQSARSASILIPPADQWEIGPVIRGRNHSVGMPPTPRAVRGGLWTFDFPVGSADAGHVHYVTFRPPSLAATSRITLRYRVEAAPGTRFVPQEQPDLPGIVSLYFQREGDNWRARRGTEYYRWYAPDASVQQLRHGIFDMSVTIADPGWTPVLGGPSPDYLWRRREAWAATSSIGLVFGSTRARGHGVYATAPARFTLLSFRID